jgi:hypothetical protein
VDDGITLAESNALIASAGISGATAKALRDYAAVARKKRGSRAALALDELNIRAADIAEKDVGQFIKDLFSAADDIDVAADVGRGFSIGSNKFRIHWIMNNILERFNIQQRTKLVEDAAQVSALSWLISYADRCMLKNNEVIAGKLSEGLIDASACGRLMNLAVERVRQAANDGTLAKKRDLIPTLFWWRSQTSENEVHGWSTEQIAQDDFVVHFADIAVQQLYSQSLGFSGLGDRVSQPRDYVPLELQQVVDLDILQARINDISQDAATSDGQMAILKRFIDAPKRRASDV